MARRGKRKGRPISGILLLNKPLGISSNRALQNAKRLFNAQKAGHTGSLDPLATGMLPICFGEATKISSFLLDSDKRYRTTATLGSVTDTGDAEGEVIKQAAIPELSEQLIESALAKFRGPITQIPPMYSALKHQGKPLYELARQGIEIERKSRDAVIHKLELTNFTESTLNLTVECTKGTYIRTLVEDIGNELGCGAFVSMLHREHVYPFDNASMIDWESLEQLTEEQRDDLLLATDTGLIDFPQIQLSAEQSKLLLLGQSIRTTLPDAAFFRIYDEKDVFLGIGIPDGKGSLRPKRIMQQQA